MQHQDSQKKGACSQLILQLLKSDDLSIDMLLPYIYDHIDNTQASKIITQKLIKLDDCTLSKWLPILVSIQFTIKSPLIENQVFTKLSYRSIPLYLLIRWNYGAFYAPESEELQIVRNKLDAKFITFLSNKQYSQSEMTQLSAEQIKLIITKKQVLSNYVGILNNFYEKLFNFSNKLTSYPLQNRKLQLHRYLDKLYNKFTSVQEIQYCTGICFPYIDSNSQYDSSCLIVNFIKSQCFPFSTKDHIPFKIVFESINFADYDRFINYQPNHQQIPEFESKKSEKSLLLPHTYFGTEWKQTSIDIRKNSPYSFLESYKIHAYIVKTGDDIRQEYFAMQLMNIFQKIFQQQHLKLWVLPYKILPFSRYSGLIQFIHDTKTISSLKVASNEKSLRIIYKHIFGDFWETAITNFTHSLAGYSLYQYLFQVKDRHNNNILVDKYGHIIHIDYSFMISSSPGNLNFQKAPFKLTEDYIELMQGLQSDIFQHFKFLLFMGLKVLRKYKKQIMSIIDIMKKCDDMKCFDYFDQQKMERRFQQNTTDQQLHKTVQNMVQEAYRSYYTSNYDRYQWYTNTIRT